MHLSRHYEAEEQHCILYPVSLLNPEFFHLHFAMSLETTAFRGFFLYTVDSIRAMWYDVADVILKEG